MKIHVTPGMLAAAWAAWRVRHPRLRWVRVPPSVGDPGCSCRQGRPSPQPIRDRWRTRCPVEVRASLRPTSRARRGPCDRLASRKCGSCSGQRVSASRLTMASPASAKIGLRSGPGDRPMNAMPRPRRSTSVTRPPATEKRFGTFGVGKAANPAAGAVRQQGVLAEYEKAIRGHTPDAEARKALTTGSLGWLIDSYMASAQWTTELSAATRAQRAGILKETKEAADTSPRTASTSFPSRRAWTSGPRSRTAPTIGSKPCAGLFGWAVSLDIVPADPTRSVEALGRRQRPQRLPHVDRGRGPRGSRLGTTLARGNGLRSTSCSTRAAARRCGPARTSACPEWHHPHHDRRPSRRSRFGSFRLLRIHCCRRATGELTFIATEKGGPYTKESFGNWFRDVCAEMELPGRAHGCARLGTSGRRERCDGGRAERLVRVGEGSRESATYVRGANRTKLAARIADRYSELLTPHHLSRCGTRLPKSD